MKLADYLSRNGLSHAAFAERIGVRQVAVTRYVNGLRMPKRDIMERIVKATDHQVLPADFFATTEAA